MRKAIKRLMAKAHPGSTSSTKSPPRSGLLPDECLLLIRSGEVSLRKKICRVNIGCGKNPIQGWINLDVVSYPDVYFWDCRSDLNAPSRNNFASEPETEAARMSCLSGDSSARRVILATYSGRRQCHRWLPSSVVQVLKKCEIRFQLSCEETSEIWSFSNVE